MTFKDPRGLSIAVSHYGMSIFIEPLDTLGVVLWQRPVDLLLCGELWDQLGALLPCRRKFP